MNMPEPLNPKDKQALQLLIDHAGQSHRVRFATLRKARFPEKLAELYDNKSEYLDSLASRKFQKLQRKGWVKLDGTGLITILHEP
jgi:hypothetical protein